MTTTTGEPVDPDGLLGDPTDPAEDPVEPATGADPVEGEEPAVELGDAGKKALDAMKAKWRAERDARKVAEDKLAAAAKPEPAEGGQVDVEELRKQIQADARAEVLRDRALDKIEAKAAGRFKDPEDALLRLGRNVDDFIDGNTIDLDAIEDALVELLEKRPDFGVTQGDTKRFKGTGDGGPKGAAGKPQLTRADVERLAKEGKHAEIEQARAEGRLNKALGIT
jgi:hypothetical protein